MNNERIFRNINNIESDLIATSFNIISAKLSPVLDKLKNFLYISINKSTTEVSYPSVYLITKEQKRVIDESNISDRIYTAGLYFGFIKKGVFYFSIEGVEHLLKSGIFTDFKRLWINESGEKSFLYGNNILKKMVIKSPPNLKEKDLLIILTKFDELIGLGLSRVDNEKIMHLKPNDIVSINLSDKGKYLRIIQ